MQGDNSLIIEVAPALSIHRIVDLALKAAPDMEPGILFTERQFGLLELHSRDAGEVNAAGDAILKGINAKASASRNVRMPLGVTISAVSFISCGLTGGWKVLNSLPSDCVW